MRPPLGHHRAARLTLALAILLPLLGGLGAGGAGRVGAASSLPPRFGIGVSAQPSADGIYGWMPDTGIAWDYAYQYLAAGVNTGQGWETWNEGAQFPLWYARGASERGYLPVFTYYDLLQSNGPCNTCGEAQRDLANLNEPTTMAAYYANFALLMQRLGPGTHDGIAGFGGPTIVHIEPDLSGYAQQAALRNDLCYGHCTGQGNNPALLRAAVAASGVAQVAGYPDTYQGFNWALLHLRDLYAPNVLLALHVSNWTTGQDIGSSRDADLDPVALGGQAGQFAALSGLATTPGGTSTYDFLFNDVADRDAGYYKYVWGRDNFWDRQNVALPNFHRWEAYLGAAIAAAGGKPAFVWQIPLGNQHFAAVNNSDGHYQDNRAEYFFSHIRELAAIGIVGLLFGAGNGGSTVNYDGKRDGVTNPAPACTTDGTSGAQLCPTAQSTVADDDGGYLRQAARQYYAAPLALPLGGPAPTPSPSPASSASPSPSAPPGGASYRLALTATAGGSVGATPAAVTYPSGTVVSLVATPEPGYAFIGWEVEGVARGWASPARLTIDRDRAVRARFAPIPPFPDLPADPAGAEAIRQLAARGIILGYEDGRFGPADPVLRAQMAALIVRALGWPIVATPPPFTDRGPVDDDLWGAVGTLAARDVARGYPDGTYDPTGPVLHIQTIAFIARAMVAANWWAAQPDDPALYPAVAPASGHRGDIATWVRYVGPVPGTTSVGEPWPAWDTAATRGWFALALWQALDRHGEVAKLP